MHNTSAVGESSAIYRDSFARALSAALFAGLVAAFVDIAITRSRGGSGPGLYTVVIGLYLPPSLLLGVFVGAIAAGFRMTFGAGAPGRAIRALAEDRALDVRVSGGLMAAAVVGLVFVLVCAFLAVRLVGSVERQGAGALLLGALMLASLPLFALGALPVYRVTRRAARYLPRVGPLPASLVLAGAAAVGVVLAGLYVVFTRLEWRALALDTYALLGSLPVLMLAWWVIWYPLLGRVRERLPARGAATVVALVAGVLLSTLALRGAPAPETVASIQDLSPGARFWLDLGRSLSDGDGDGFSALLGGPDCDDKNPHVHPEAKEILDNGIDDNCMGGDRKSAPEPAVADGGGPAPAGAGAGADKALAVADAPPIKNALIILVDTVRADRLGVAGYRRDGKSLTPRLDALAQEGSYFTRAYAQSPNTPRSLPSIFTSRFPSQVAVDKSFKNYPRVLDENLTVFEALQQAGVYTAGFASHFYFVEERNIRQGFDMFDNEGALDIAGSNKDIASPRIVPKAEAKLAELAKDGRRFAMFVHLFEPHSTYVEHEGFAITERGILGLMQKYDYEIAYVDQWVGRLLDALAQNGLADDTLVVVLADHGEAFGVHRIAGKKMYFHGQTLYDELMRVPLIMRVPGAEPGVYDDVSMLVDVAPTLLDAMGVERPASFSGRSLLARIRGGAPAPRFAYAELLPAPSWNHSARMMVAPDGRHKVYAHTSEQRFELFDLGADPEETKDLSRAMPEQLERMKEELLRFVEVDLQ